MEMSGEQKIRAPRETVWDALNDPEILKKCIAGCRSLERKGDTAFEATVASKVGPVKATFKGAVNLSEIDRPNSYVISGEGQGGPAGFAKGSARVQLAGEGPETLLVYTVEANVGGKLAQIGSKLVDMAARKMAEDFFRNFCETVEDAPEESAPQDAQGQDQNPQNRTDEASPPVIPTWGWGVCIAACAGLAWYFLS